MRFQVPFQVPFQVRIPARFAPPPSIFTLRSILFLLTLPFLSTPGAVHAGVSNPDISALGQVLGSHTDDAGSPDADQPALRLGEAEFIINAYLNPYIKGWFTIAGGEDGFALEEAYASVIKGLPWGLNLKAGKYRLGFGKLNAIHPHAYPFLDAPRSLQSLLFGEEGFNETGVQVSALLPTPGDWASTLTADLIEGKAFHEASDGPDGSGTRLGAVGRWANTFLIGERGAFETGFSGATGIDSVGRDSRAWLAGADAKAKFHLTPLSQLVIQGEAVFKHSHVVADAADTATGAFAAEDRIGFYAFADYRWHSRWSGGLLYEQWEREGEASKVDRAFRVFGCFAVMEESTLLRLMYERLLPQDQDAINTVALQLLFSMGPHKPHQF